jgi:hypothetical protein
MIIRADAVEKYYFVEEKTSKSEAVEISDQEIMPESSQNRDEVFVELKDTELEDKHE